MARSMSEHVQITWVQVNSHTQVQVRINERVNRTPRHFPEENTHEGTGTQDEDTKQIVREIYQKMVFLRLFG